MDIWIISLFDPTPIDNAATGRFIGIAQAAVKRGHTVTHFTSTFRHTAKKHRFMYSQVSSIKENYSVEYIHSMGYKQNMRPRRFIAHWDFAKKLVQTFKTKNPPAIIFISMPPLSVADKVTSWAKMNKVPVVLDIIDPWPDSFIKDVPLSLKPLVRVLLFPFYNKLKGSLKRSSALTAISKGYLEWTKNYNSVKNQPSNCFYPAVDLAWVQNEIAKFKTSSSRPYDKLRLIYAGSLASSYDITCICRAAEIIDKKFKGQTEFLIAGTGPQEPVVREYQSKLSNLSYLGWVNRDELMKEYASCDLGFIQHMNSLTQTVTYKLFSYLSAGIPILNSLQSEMVDIIQTNLVGLNNKEGDYEQLAKNIEFFINNPDKLKAYKANALQLTAKHGDTKVVYDRLAAFLENISSKS